MKIVDDMDQGSPLWLQWRSKGLGSSDASVLVFGKHFDTDVKGLYEDKIGKGGPREENFAMSRGKRLEPRARALYAKLMGIEPVAICSVHDQYPWIKASLDGWDRESHTMTEIKCPNKYDHQDALDGILPSKYWPQVWHQLLVGEGEVEAFHYVSYSDYFPMSRRLAVVTINLLHPGLWTKVNLLRDKEIEFWDFVQRRVQPKNFLPLVSVLESQGLTVE